MAKTKFTKEQLSNFFGEILKQMGYSTAPGGNNFWEEIIFNHLQGMTIEEFETRLLFATGIICEKRKLRFNPIRPGILPNWKFIDLYKYWFTNNLWNKEE